MIKKNEIKLKYSKQKGQNVQSSIKNLFETNFFDEKSERKKGRKKERKQEAIIKVYVSVTK